MKKYLSFALVFLLVLSLLAGCGASNETADGLVQENGSNAPSQSQPSKGQPSQDLADTVSGTSAPLPANQKLIRNIYLDAETEDLDGLLSIVNQRISELEGYIEAQSIHNGSHYAGGNRHRYANLTIRIPADKLDQFVEKVSGSANIVSSEETVEDVTLSYIATESRILALETEQTRLLELLAKAENMNDILQIESRLTDIRHELEQVTSQLRLYDNMVNYGTVHLSISEVREYTVVTEPDTVWDRIGDGFASSLDNIGDFFVELFIFIVVSLPYLLPMAVAGLVVILLVRAKRRKKKANREKPAED